VAAMVRVTYRDHEALPDPALDSTTQPRALVRRLAAEPVETQVEAMRPLADATARTGQGPTLSMRAQALSRILVLVSGVTKYLYFCWSRSTWVPRDLGLAQLDSEAQLEA
jgi:hypothetical protein